MIVTRREFVRRQRLNAEKQKETDLQAKLTQMQKSTSTQLDDKVNDKVDKTVPRAVREILAENLNTKAFKKMKRTNSLNTSSTDGVNKSLKAVTENPKSDTMANQPLAPMVRPILQTSNVPQTFTDASGNQFLMVPVSTGQTLPLINTTPTSGQVYFNTGSQGGRFQRGGRGYRGRFNRGSTKHSVFFYAYCMIVHHLTFLKIK